MQPAGRGRRAKSERTLHRESLYGAPVPGPGMDVAPVHAWPETAPLRVGTSGWAYRHWLGRFYPRDLKSEAQLAHYAARFPTVEVNSTYYRLPSEAILARWRDATPEGFRFTIKAPGSITHDKRLADAATETREFVQRCVGTLGEKLGVLLFQLPPGFHADLPRLRAFLELLPDGHRYAFELRHRSWFERDVYMALAQKGAAFVVHDFSQRGSRIVETAPFVYLRLHGATGRYRGAYDRATLIQWSEQVREWLGRGFEAWCYFNNDERAKSVRNALELWRDAEGF